MIFTKNIWNYATALVSEISELFNAIEVNNIIILLIWFVVCRNKMSRLYQGIKYNIKSEIFNTK